MAEVHMNSQMAAPIKTGAEAPVIQRPKTKIPDRVKESERAHEDRMQKLIKDEIAKSRDDVRTKEYGPVIARSSDGDTVRVKKDELEERYEQEKRESAIYDKARNESGRTGEEEIPDVELPEIELEEYEPEFDFKPIPYEPGEFLEKTKQEAIKAQDSAREIYKEASIDGASSSTGQVGSYSDSMLKEMYLKGDISQISYEREMEAREEQRKAREMDDRAFSADMAEDDDRIREMERTREVIRDVENGDVNTSDDAPSLDQRLQAIQNADAM
ncbi:hypothetical protein [Butyrivibrio sp. INlla21]|uniref:hypothetical protein n=1 Tax=Butyrivibrio sp. INlla21 TaxID=1520811 RepID=UPI0008EF8594|nr:hypothetical protein [Butyrivibrio sp. INlla21]SFV04141.1 hypothetical protein SAMN02910342_03184 [Butyrivibrio sp. INlla21]